MIVNLPYPVFFDMETIFSGEFANKLKIYNIKRTGLVKMDHESDTSTLTGGISSRESLLKPLICGDTKKPYIRWRVNSKGKFLNIPKLRESNVHPSKYLRYIEEGYNETSGKLLLKKKCLFNIVKETKSYVRVIIRPTRIYRFLLLKSYYPQIYLHQGLSSFFRNSLQNYDVIYKINDRSLLNTEITALLNSQIPTFYSDLKEKEILSFEGENIATWNQSLFEIWDKYQKDLDLQFFNKQKKLLESRIR